VSSFKDFHIIASNEYGVFVGDPYPWMQDVEGTQLVEPYKTTSLTLDGTIIDKDSHYVWNIKLDSKVTKIENFRGTLANTANQTLVFQQVGIYTVTVVVFNKKGDQTYSYVSRLVCKYVKREIRTLTLGDKERFLNAAMGMWDHNQKDGDIKYGDKFTSIETFVAVHSLASNDIMCDGFHEGTGFLTHHLALTNAFEASLRAIDPSVTLPYWDFTIEGEAIKEIGEVPSYMMKITPVFSDEWFGSVDPNTNRITNSRWKSAKMTRNKQSTRGVQNSYGYIRSYWNNNNDDVITRHLFDTCGLEPIHKLIPTCEMHYNVLNSPDLGAFLMSSPGEGHGPMHVQIGGVYGGCVEVYIYINIYNIYICVYIYTYIYIYMHIHNIYMHIYIYIYVYI
jgi:hypothetical protein